jgi:wyosine [tRNA(Phe)-imidazoG37] synthetase (radical SAM superfamily)
VCIKRKTQESIGISKKGKVMLLRLQDGILYGPINSRRLGPSLGINLMPRKYKLCSFNCLYCHYGLTKQHALDLEPYRRDLPSLDAVLIEVEKGLRSSLEFNYLTFSGNGEPTIYPDFPEAVERVAELRNRLRPAVKLALLSNATGLIQPEVQACIARIDRPFFKLDAGTEAKWRIINRPCHGIAYDRIIEALAALNGLTIQTALFDGKPSNVTDSDLDAYFSRIVEIQPDEVHLYSIDRPVPSSSITLIPPDRLREIAALGRERTGIKMTAFFAGGEFREFSEP